MQSQQIFTQSKRIKIINLNNRNSKSNFKRFTNKDKAFSYYIYNEIISIYENKQLK